MILIQIKILLKKVDLCVLLYDSKVLSEYVKKYNWKKVKKKTITVNYSKEAKRNFKIELTNINY
ncbi:hypothetical protein [Polaribacter sp. Z022]|uniref:hypothetical protein n=1 Tax=Polaribacter sp. Z022 TaxID=2927125 RepID=UPI0020225614|nr:hypothetical protein [Polaribacter sp. Z022]MCL7753080.1 hypothetical protein [Polaribacter sp. Z022]